MNEILIALAIVIGAPVYLYLVSRIMASGITRSILETKREFRQKEGG